MPDYLLPSPAPGALYIKAVSGQNSRASAGFATRVYLAAPPYIGGFAAITAAGSQSVASPLFFKRVETARFGTNPILPRDAATARRVSGLIWPRQFRASRPENGVLIPRLRGVGAPASFASGDFLFGGENLTLNGENLTLN
ncbi:MAG TPA: hypothetical protein VGB45_06140 [Abditibacterium sp.]|jgi:hypothetical protein